jgi:hypothetical protein
MVATFFSISVAATKANAGKSVRVYRVIGSSIIFGRCFARGISSAGPAFGGTLVARHL